MLEVINITKGYESGFSISDISMNIEKGTIHGIIGENGSGKTTLIKCLMGIYRPDSGEVLYDGKQLFDNPDVKKHIGYVADSSHYFIDYSVKDMIKFYKQTYDYFDDELFRRYNKKFKLGENLKVGQLSKGQNMKLAFMLNMSIHPELLIMDEPTAGLDVIAKKELLDIVISEVEKNGLTVVISSHHLEEIEKICDNITLINAGRIIFDDELVKLKDRYVKYQIVLTEDAYDVINGLKGLVDVSNVGSIYTFVFNEKRENPEEIFSRAGAKFIVVVKQNCNTC